VAHLTLQEPAVAPIHFVLDFQPAQSKLHADGEVPPKAAASQAIIIHAGFVRFGIVHDGLCIVDSL
jgi:hypothetical protein